MDAFELKCYKWLCEEIHKARIALGDVEAEKGHYCPEAQKLMENVEIMEELCSTALARARYVETERRIKVVEAERAVAIKAMQVQHEEMERLKKQIQKLNMEKEGYKWTEQDAGDCE